MKYDSEVLKDFLKAQPGEKEFSVKMGEESMHNRFQLFFFQTHIVGIMS